MRLAFSDLMSWSSSVVSVMTELSWESLSDFWERSEISPSKAWVMPKEERAQMSDQRMILRGDLGFFWLMELF